jgi:hypothetical protein
MISGWDADRHSDPPQIRNQPSQHPHQVDDVGFDAPTMLPRPVRFLRTRKLARSSPAQRMTTSSPSFFTRTTTSSNSMRAIRLRAAVGRPFGLSGGIDVHAEPQ